MSAEYNPYAPPIADVTSPAAEAPPYFSVSTKKFVVMCLFTLSLYEVYWFYKNWKAIRENEGADISPFWRTFFIIFYCYPLLKRIREREMALGGASFAAGPMAAGWITFSLVANLPGSIGILGLFSFLFMLPPQKAIERINASVAPSHDRNDHFTAWNWVAMVIGALFGLLAIVGALLPDG